MGQIEGTDTEQIKLMSYENFIDKQIEQYLADIEEANKRENT